MLARIVATVGLILILAFIYLSPQGLLTKPTLVEMNAGPYRLRDMQKATRIEATNQIIDLAFEDSLLQVGWLPCMINKLLVSGEDTVQIGLINQDCTSGKSDTVATGVTDILWPEGECLIASFPYRGRHSMKLGSWKVYRGLQHEIMKRRLPPAAVLEIFDVEAEEIRYLMPLE